MLVEYSPFQVYPGTDSSKSSYCILQSRASFTSHVVCAVQDLQDRIWLVVKDLVGRDQRPSEVAFDAEARYSWPKVTLESNQEYTLQALRKNPDGSSEVVLQKHHAEHTRKGAHQTLRTAESQNQTEYSSGRLPNGKTIYGIIDADKRYWVHSYNSDGTPDAIAERTSGAEEEKDTPVVVPYDNSQFSTCAHRRTFSDPKIAPHVVCVEHNTPSDQIFAHRFSPSKTNGTISMATARLGNSIKVLTWSGRDSLESVRFRGVQTPSFTTHTTLIEGNVTWEEGMRSVAAVRAYAHPTDFTVYFIDDGHLFKRFGGAVSPVTTSQASNVYAEALGNKEQLVGFNNDTGAWVIPTVFGLPPTEMPTPAPTPAPSPPTTPVATTTAAQILTTGVTVITSIVTTTMEMLPTSTTTGLPRTPTAIIAMGGDPPPESPNDDSSTAIIGTAVGVAVLTCIAIVGALGWAFNRKRQKNSPPPTASLNQETSAPIYGMANGRAAAGYSVAPPPANEYDRVSVVRSPYEALQSPLDQGAPAIYSKLNSDGVPYETLPPNEEDR